MFLLYVTSVGVSASNSTGSLNSPATLAHTTTVYRTKTITKTITKTSTSTVFVDSTTTATTTSFVCCQTTTTTVTEPASTTTVTSTVTETPNIQSGSNNFATTVDDTPTIFDNTGATHPDCQVTVSVSTVGITTAESDGTTVNLYLVVVNGNGVQTQTGITSGSDVLLYTQSFSGASVGFNVFFNSANTDDVTVTVYWSVHSSLSIIGDSSSPSLFLF